MSEITFQNVNKVIKIIHVNTGKSLQNHGWISFKRKTEENDRFIK